MKRINLIVILVTGLFLIYGCAVVVGDKVVGVSSGKFIYTDGILTTVYSAPFDKIWKACEKTVADMMASDIEKDKKIATGTIDAVVSGDKIHISAKYVSKDSTTVSVRVGLAGNNFASQLIHEKIKEKISK